MPPKEVSKPQKARVASIHLCKDTTCSYTLSPHLAIENLEVPLEEGQATAISYAWGEFNRQQVLVGHSEDEGRRRVTLELGEEWSVQDVIERLAELSSNSPIWLDQLCIVQKDEAIRETLAKIPAIFSTFHVVALMPDHPCKCLDEFVHKFKLHNPDEWTDLDDHAKAIKQGMKDYQECISFTAPSSWFRRLWTRQELMYSRRIHCVWASKITPPCVRGQRLDTDGAARLPRYLAHKRQSFLDQGYNHSDAYKKLCDQQERLAKHARQEMLTYALLSLDSVVEKESYFHVFLHGAALKNGSRFDATSPGKSTINFWKELAFLTLSFKSDLVTRTSTHLQDYVLAVFPDWTEYVVPEKPGTHKMHSLMQDALNQLRAKEAMTILTTAPQGLFDGTSRDSAFWHPDYYHRVLESVKNPSEITLRDVYSPIYPEGTRIFCVKQWMAITFPANSEPPISTTAKDYDSYMAELVNKHGEDEAKTIIVEQVRPAIREWTTNSIDTLQEYITAELHEFLFGIRPTAESAEWGLKRILHAILEAKLAGLDDVAAKLDNSAEILTKNFGSSFKKSEWSVETIARVLYRMMAIALRLNEDICHESGIKIMVSCVESRPMRLGFYRGNINLSSLGLEAEGRGGIKSIRMNPNGLDTKGPGFPLIYEAEPADQPMKLESGGFQRCYKVFGVWIPFQGMTEDRQEYNAELWRPGSQAVPDAWLV